MEFDEILKRFYKMEAELNLFERQDTNKIFYWDLFRFDIFDELTEAGQSYKEPLALNAVSIPNILKKTWNIFKAIPCLFTREPYFAYICSRNNYKGGDVLFDQNAQDILSLIDKNKLIINESFSIDMPTIYDNYKHFSGIDKFARFVKSPNYIPREDFKLLTIEIKKYFPKCMVNEDRLTQLYIKFYKERRLYYMIFKTIKPRKILITQNGILKGIFAAAKDCGINVYEFQHGIINNGHLAYSYPILNNIEDKVYTPTYLLTLSDFWLKDCYIPYTQEIVIGNDYFIPKRLKTDCPKKNKILFVSSSFMQKELFSFLAECKSNMTEFYEYEIIYKLHPNEFERIDEYRKYFQDYANIKVSTNEKNISKWMEECSTMITILSTAAYEALQCTRKVIVLKRLNYQMMHAIFSCDNVYTIDSTEEFIDALHKPILNSNVEYFKPFNSVIANEIINC